MAIVCTTLYEDVCDQLGKGTGNERLASRFPRAVNRALDELAAVSDRATQFTHVTATDSTVSELSSSDEWILYAGVLYNLMTMGQSGGDPRLAAVQLSDAQRRWEGAKDMYIVKLDNAIQSDTYADMIGLGKLGDTSASS